MINDSMTIIRACIAIAWADKRLTRDEQELLKSLIASTSLNTEEKKQLLQEIEQPLPLERLKPSISQLSIKEKEYLLSSAWKMVLVEGNINIRQEEMFHQLTEICGLPLGPVRRLQESITEEIKVFLRKKEVPYITTAEMPLSSISLSEDNINDILNNLVLENPPKMQFHLQQLTYHIKFKTITITTPIKLEFEIVRYEPIKKQIILLLLSAKPAILAWEWVMNFAIDDIPFLTYKDKFIILELSELDFFQKLSEIVILKNFVLQNGYLEVYFQIL